MSTDEQKNLKDNPAASGPWCSDASRPCCLKPSQEELESPNKSYCFLGSHIECSKFTHLKEVYRADRG